MPICISILTYEDSNADADINCPWHIYSQIKVIKVAVSKNNSTGDEKE